MVVMPGVSMARDLTLSVPGDELPRLMQATPISATQVRGRVLACSHGAHACFDAAHALLGILRACQRLVPNETN